MADESLSACLAEIKAHPGEYYAYILCRPCGTPFYVGLGSKRRIASHHWRAKSEGVSDKSTIFREIWSSGQHVRYRISGFFFDRSEGQKEERRLIASFGRVDLGTGPLVNLTEGGEVNFPISAAGRERLRRFRLGRPHGEETKRKIGDINRGKIMSAESRQKMSRARHGRKPSDIAIENARQSNKGRPLTASHREKLAAAKIGRPLSAEHRRKVAEALRGRIVCADTRLKLRAANRTRKEVTLGGITYRSRIDAMNALRIGRKALDRLIRAGASY